MYLSRIGLLIYIVTGATSTERESMGTILGVVMDPISTINIKKDSTIAMLLAAQARGWSVRYMTPADLWLDDGEACAAHRGLTIDLNASPWHTLGEPVSEPLAALDVVLMRKDPPFDNEFLYSTYILERAEAAGSLIVNRPSALRDCNEKLFATEFPQCCPPLLVSRSGERLREFHREHGDIILKPLDGMGGTSIFRARADEPNLGVIIEMLTNHGATTIMAQRYLPEIKDGDKRILVVDGEVVPYCLARIPKQGETRGNLAAGGTGRAQPLSERDHWIAAQIVPTLNERGLIFVGLDVIGDYLTEINVTSPTCIREIDNAYDTDIGGMLIAAIAKKLNV